MRFSDIYGHQEAKDTLRSLVRNDRLPHALMLLGPSGSGKLALAIAFARYVLCEDPQEQEVCDRCPACTKTRKLLHPDLHFTFPSVGTKVTSEAFMAQWRQAMQENPYLELHEWLQLIGAENRQGNINKEECVRIIKKLSLKAYEGSHKVLIMWMPELLGKEGNRLLKLIEEPPPHTLIVLVAEQAGQILNTIRSRCQLVKVPPFSDEEIRQGLLRQFPDLGSRAQSAAFLADGDYNEARRLVLHQENNNASLFLKWMRKCYQGNGVELVKWVDHFAGLGRENQKYFLRYALHFLREYLLLKMTGAERVRLREDELTTARKLMAVIELDQVEVLIRVFTECTHHVERNANPKILFLDASIQVHRVLKRKQSAVA